MLRRHFFRSGASAAAGAIAFPALLSSSADRADDASAQLQNGQFALLRRGVGLFTERGGTIGYLAGADALVMVDAQYPETAQHAYGGLHERTGRTLDVLVNTHHHGDHTAGNATLAPLASRHLAHARVPDLMRASTREGQATPPTPAETFEIETSVDLGDETMRLLHFGAGHTAGDAVVRFDRANVIHTGDLVFNRIPPFIDPGTSGADTTNWQTVLQQVHDLGDADTLFIFGHAGPGYGVVGTQSDVRAMGQYLEALVAYVAAARAAGRSLEETQTLRLDAAPEFYAPEGFLTVARNIEAVWQEMSAGE
jgi:glyoxylase-like metal-dependent hydrolase (beta-lactamase superfamily II)